MSSSTDATTGGDAGETAASHHYFYCHRCHLAVVLTSHLAFVISCPICREGFLEGMEIPPPPHSPTTPLEGFLEEMEAPPPPPPHCPTTSLEGFLEVMVPPPPPPHCPTTPLEGFLEEMEALPPPNPNPSDLSPSTPISIEIRHPSDLLVLFGAAPTVHPGAEGPGSIDPRAVLRNQLLRIMATGANFEIVLGDGTDDGVNSGEITSGPSIQQIIQQILEIDPICHGNLPAARSVIASLLDLTINPDNEETVDEECQEECHACLETLRGGDEGEKMPCKHIYHSDCLLQWLAMHNTCPKCLYELPNNDADYELRRRGTTDSIGGLSSSSSENQNSRDLVTTDGSSSSTSEGQNSTGQPVAARMIRLTLPWWTLRWARSLEDSNAGSSNSDSSNQGDGRPHTPDEASN